MKRKKTSVADLRGSEQRHTVGEVDIIATQDGIPSIDRVATQTAPETTLCQWQCDTRKEPEFDEHRCGRDGPFAE